MHFNAKVEHTILICKVRQNLQNTPIAVKLGFFFTNFLSGSRFRTSGICAPYNGTRCKSVLGSSSVFLNLSRSNPFKEQEQLAGELLDQMFSVEAPETIHTRCDGHGQKLICNYMFPPCTHYLDPKPVPLCR